MANQDSCIGLSVRVKNALQGNGYYSREDIEAAVDDGTFNYAKMKNFGLKGYEEVMRWLGRELPKKEKPRCPHCGKEL